MASLRNGVLYGHCDENVGAKVAKRSDPNQRIPVPVVEKQCKSDEEEEECKLEKEGKC